jgi:hypothetical protein
MTTLHARNTPIANNLNQFSVFRNFLQQNNDESVAANETVVRPEAVDTKESRDSDEKVDEKSDQFVVTQEYIQDSMQKLFLTTGV